MIVPKILGIFIVFSILIIVPANAQTQEITVKHWFISSNSEGCSTGNIQALQYYEKLTPQYLAEYDIHGIQEKGKCIAKEQVKNNIEEFESTLNNYDLPIVILDAFSGLDYVLSTDALGHYQWKGFDRIIVFASLSPFIESDTGAWILSHELAHFALHYNNHPSSVYGEWVHTIEAKARQCLNDNGSLNQCPDLWTTVKSPAGKSVKVMTIYEESSPISENSFQKPQSSDISQLDSECLSLYLNKKYQDAIDVCLQVIDATNPQTNEYQSALSWLSKSYEKIGNYQMAIKYGEALVQLQPNDFSVLTNLCYTHLSAENYVDAFWYGKQALGIKNEVTADICFSGAERELRSKQPTFDVKPILTNGHIQNTWLDAQKSTLGLDIQTTNKGELQVTIPRKMLDAKIGNSDGLFTVKSDGTTTSYEEIETSDSERVLKISVPSGSNRITISGTDAIVSAKVIPEFGSFVTIVLFLSIISVITLTRSKFRI